MGHSNSLAKVNPAGWSAFGSAGRSALLECNGVPGEWDGIGTRSFVFRLPPGAWSHLLAGYHESQLGQDLWPE